MNIEALNNFLAQSIAIDATSQTKRSRQVQYNENAITIRINKGRKNPNDKVVTFRIGTELIKEHELVEKYAFDLSVPLPVFNEQGEPLTDEEGNPKKFFAIGLMNNKAPMNPHFGREGLGVKKDKETKQNINVPVEELIEEGKEFTLKADPLFEVLVEVYPQIKDCDKVEITLGDEVNLTPFVSSTPQSKVQKTTLRSEEDMVKVFVANFEFFGLPSDETISLEEAEMSSPEEAESLDDEVVELESEEVTEDHLDNSPEEVTEEKEIESSDDIIGWS